MPNATIEKVNSQGILDKLKYHRKSRTPSRYYLHSKCKLSVTISDAGKKGKKFYFALSDIGSKYLNLTTVSHLYKCVVLPSHLYGCQLSSNISFSDLQLNTFQHFECKNALELPTLSRSDISESHFTFNLYQQIATRKLLSIGRLCRLDCDALL